MSDPSNGRIVTPGSGVSLGEIDPRDTGGVTEEAGRAAFEADRARIADLQHALYAEGERALLVVLQGTDASGKDGAARRVFAGVNPAGVTVTSFKAPTAHELSHDYLRRAHVAAPARGTIGVFNRSHYEDVLIARVDGLVPKKVWSRRYRHINEFERTLTDEGTTILKLHLHISRAEQRERLLKRLTDPEKNWKFSADDFEKRERWDDYIAAREEMLERCSTEHAPWRIVPADRKWFRNHVIARLVVRTLEGMAPRFPPLSDAGRRLLAALE